MLNIAVEGIDGSGKSTLSRQIATDFNLELISSGSGPRPLRKLYSKLISTAESFPNPSVSLLLGLADYLYQQSRIPDKTELAGNGCCWDRYAYSALADAIALGVGWDIVSSVSAMIPPAWLTVFVDVSPRTARCRCGRVSLAEAGGPDWVKKHGNDREKAFVAYQGEVRKAYCVMESKKMLGRAVLHVDGEEGRAALAGRTRMEILRRLGESP